MAKKIRKCVVCGTEYEYCGNCAKDAKKEAWYYSFCSNKCKKTYDITCGYENGLIEAAEANKELTSNNVQLKDVVNSYKATIEKILNAINPIKKEEKVLDKPVKKG